MFTSSRHPEIVWAQRSDKVYLTVELPDSKDTKVNITPEGLFTYSAVSGPDNAPYSAELSLFEKINVEVELFLVFFVAIVCNDDVIFRQANLV